MQAHAVKLNVVLCWHMHQPDYRHQGVYQRPWTWLHAIKDYSDMTAHLENIPEARAVVNFSPVLIEQLQDYPARIRAFLSNGTAMGDAVLDGLARQPAGEDEQLALLPSLLRVNETTVKPRFEAYANLFEQARQALAEQRPLGQQQFDDLIVWYVLAWLGESLREEELPRRLQNQAAGFGEADRWALLAFVGETCAGLLYRYRALAEAGKVELSVSPYAHPILPLLRDFKSAQDAWPDVVLPSSNYPGGESRCDWHLAEAKRVFSAAFGRSPDGCWPSEGGISEASLRQLGRHGFKWTASGTRVLLNSLGDSSAWPQLYPWRLAGNEPGQHSPVCFFRDDALSDRIGFEYSRWPATDAVADLVRQIERIDAEGDASGEAVLSIIMDGENAWEYYPHNGQEFLQNLYRELGRHPKVRVGTFADVLARCVPGTLKQVKAGSWVHGNFSTWVGDAAKNHAWDLLTTAKAAVDEALAPEMAAARAAGREPGPRVAAVQRQLAVCEASDWFWWLGEDNRLEDGPAFDQLFRLQLSGLYLLIGVSPPASLQQPVNAAGTASAGQENAAAGAMRTAG